MILKRTILVIVVLFIKTIVFSQVTHNSDNNYIAVKYSLTPDTIEVKIKKIAFITYDKIFNGFMIFDTLGLFYSFGSRQRLDEYITSQTEIFFYYEDDKILGTGNYIRVFKTIDKADTIYSYRNAEIDYYDGENLKVDNLGIPILEYDIEHSYILQQMNQNISNQYIYCLINDGTKRFYGIHPSNYLKNSVLLKVDTSQDTTYNFFMYRAQTKSYQGMQLIAKDSVILPLKKLKRQKWVFSSMGELLTSKEDSDVYSNNFETTRLIIIGDKRFITSYNYYLKQKVDEWVLLVESISITLEQLQEKVF